MNAVAILDTVKRVSLGGVGLGAPVVLLILLAMLVLPLPPFLLDVFFTFNIAISLVVILVAVYTLRPLDFSVFPTVLLITTLLRLALNVASTRVVLLEGHQGGDAAGKVIEAFGDFVIGGNYAVGLVVFAILVIINFVVVTKGAGRVSEVSARFTLDAMPGKQMAIDADLNAGLINQDEARRRREDVAREADFYGSMDGASKFVRGDAVAGILILFINIIGGLSVGVGQHGLDFNTALHNYTLLTIGDGLVAQMPVAPAVDRCGDHRHACRRFRGHGRAGRAAGLRQPARAGDHGGRARHAGHDPRHAEPGLPRARWWRRRHGLVPAPAASAGRAGGGRGACAGRPRRRAQGAELGRRPAGRHHRSGGRLPAHPDGRPQPGRHAAQPDQGRAQEALPGAGVPRALRAHPGQPRPGRRTRIA